MLDFRNIYDALDPNIAWNLLKEKLLMILNKHAPFIEKKIKGKPCPWLTANVKSYLNERDQLLRMFRKTRKDEDCNIYKTARNFANAQIKRSKQKYYQDLLNQEASNPVKF